MWVTPDKGGGGAHVFLMSDTGDMLLRRAQKLQAWWRPLGCFRRDAVSAYDDAGRAYFKAGVYKAAYSCFMTAYELGCGSHFYAENALECIVALQTLDGDDVKAAYEIVQLRRTACDKLDPLCKIRRTQATCAFLNACWVCNPGLGHILYVMDDNLWPALAWPHSSTQGRPVGIAFNAAARTLPLHSQFLKQREEAV